MHKTKPYTRGVRSTRGARITGLFSANFPSRHAYTSIDWVAAISPLAYHSKGELEPQNVGKRDNLDSRRASCHFLHAPRAVFFAPVLYTYAATIEVKNAPLACVWTRFDKPMTVRDVPVCACARLCIGAR